MNIGVLMTRVSFNSQYSWDRLQQTRPALRMQILPLTRKTEPFEAIRFARQKPTSEEIASAKRLMIRMPYYQSDLKWALQVDQGIQEAVEKMDTFGTVDDLMAFLAEKYQLSKIAQVESSWQVWLLKKLNTGQEVIEDMVRDAKRFGEPRNHSDMIQIDGRGKFKLYRQRALKMLENPSSSKDLRFNIFQSASVERSEPFRVIKTKLDGREEVVFITGYIKDMFSGKKALQWFVRTPSYKSEYFKDSLMVELDKQFQSVKRTARLLKQGRLPKNERTLEQITAPIATMHWLLSLCMIYTRGSAGIADMLSKSLLRYSGIEYSRYRKMLSPDLEAFVTLLEDYTQNYTGFFDQPLRFQPKALP